MRFSYQVGMSDADHYLPLAKAAEAAGFHGITIPDSICYPKECSSKYPYNKDGSREFLESVPFLESLIAVTAMAAVTERIRFATFVYKLAGGGQAGPEYPAALKQPLRFRCGNKPVGRGLCRVRRTLGKARQALRRTDRHCTRTGVR